MLKLRFSEPFKKQYMDGKVNVCKYECTVIDNTDKSVVAKFCVTGSAKCSPNDTVNPEFGSKLADSRAKLIAYRTAAKMISPERYQAMAERINREIGLLEFVDFMRYMKKKEIDHIEDICTEA